MAIGRSIGWYADRLEPDALRYAIASILPEQNDTDLTEEEIVRRINEELVATWGNLVNRVLTITSRNFDGKVPSPGSLTADDQQIVDGVDSALSEIASLIERVELKAGLRAAMDAATTVNVYLNATEPWKLVKTDRERAGTVLVDGYSGDLRSAGCICSLSPVHDRHTGRHDRSRARGDGVGAS